MKAHEKAKSFCEEFSTDVIIDHTRFSIIVNIDTKYLRTVKKEMEKLNYKLIFTKNFKSLDSITLCFTLQ